MFIQIVTLYTFHTVYITIHKQSVCFYSAKLESGRAIGLSKHFVFTHAAKLESGRAVGFKISQHGPWKTVCLNGSMVCHECSQT